MSIQRQITQQVICSPQRVGNLLIFNRASHSHITIHSPSHASGLFVRLSNMRTAMHYLFNREVSRFKCVNTCKLKDSFLSKYPVICFNGTTLPRTVGTLHSFTLHSQKLQHRLHTNGHYSQQRQLILNRRPLSSISNKHWQNQLNLEQQRHYRTDILLCSHMQYGIHKLILSNPTRNPYWFATSHPSLRRYCTAASLSISDERVARYISRMKEQHQTATKQYADGTCSFKDVAQLQPLMDAVAKYEAAMEERKELQGLVEGKYSTCKSGMGHYSSNVVVTITVNYSKTARHRALARSTRVPNRIEKKKHLTMVPLCTKHVNNVNDGACMHRILVLINKMLYSQCVSIIFDLVFKWYGNIFKNYGLNKHSNFTQLYAVYRIFLINQMSR